MDMTMKMNSMMSDHEWHLLILKAKGKWMSQLDMNGKI